MPNSETSSRGAPSFINNVGSNTVIVAPSNAAHQHILHCSDDESAVWFSHLIREIWPYVANIAQYVLLEYVQPAMSAFFPKILRPRFTKIDIGEESVTVESVHVHQRKYNDGDTAAVIEVDISYHGHPDIQMTFAEIACGVSEVTVKGRVEIVMRPLLERIPLIGAFQIAFINRPEVDYKLTGLGGFGARSDFMRRGIQNVVDDVLAKAAVLPNRVAYKGILDTDYFHFSAHPVGILRVAALKGAGFPATDRNIFKQAVGICEQPDVYLTLTHGSIVVSTDTINDNADPVWDNELFDFVLTSESASQEIRVEAWDYDLGSNDDFLGKASVLVSELIRNGTKDIQLIGSPENATPTITLAAKWLTISSDLRHIQHAIMTQRSDALRPKNCSPLLLTIEVDEGHNLPSQKRPYVKVKVGSQTFQTNAAYNLEGMFSVENPEFEQSFHVSLKGCIDASVKIEFDVLDTSGELLGKAFSTVAEAIEAGPSGKIYNFALLQAQKANASLRVRLRLAAVLDHPPLWKVLKEPPST